LFFFPFLSPHGDSNFLQNIKIDEMKELSVIQKTYDCIKWYVPIIERLPKTHKFTLGDRIINQLYDLLE